MVRLAFMYSHTRTETVQTCFDVLIQDPLPESIHCQGTRQDWSTVRQIPKKSISASTFAETGDRQ